VEAFQEGIQNYLRNMWNFTDSPTTLFTCSWPSPRIAVCIQQVTDITANPCTAYIPCELWDDFDPQLTVERRILIQNILLQEYAV
jgi:hypothetical protein